MLTQFEVRNLFDYNSESGALSRKVARSNFVSVGDQPGWIENTGYRRIHISGKSYLAHKVIWLWVTGVWPEFDIEHIDRCRSNNTWNNLRAASRASNMANGSVRKSQTGKTGAYANKSGYMSKIKVGNDQVYIGQFKTADEAEAAFIKKHKEIHGEFSRYSR